MVPPRKTCFWSPFVSSSLEFVPHLVCLRSPFAAEDAVHAKPAVPCMCHLYVGLTLPVLQECRAMAEHPKLTMQQELCYLFADRWLVCHLLL